MQKIGKGYCIYFDNTCKTSFWVYLGPFLTQKLQNKVYPKKIIDVSFYSAVSKKSERFLIITFHKT